MNISNNVLRNCKIFNCSQTYRYMAYWNKDWKPGPFPTTEKEKVAAAKKYGLLREEYEVHPDDGNGIGDYPLVPLVSSESRDPYYPWDFPEYRRNFGEVLHHEEMLYGGDRYDKSGRLRFSFSYLLAGFLGTIAVSILLTNLGENACFLPHMPKHLPANGTFFKYPTSEPVPGGHH